MNKIDDILQKLSQQPMPDIDNPDELTESIMDSLPNRQQPRRHQIWLYMSIAAVAACFLLLLMPHHKNYDLEKEYLSVLARHTEQRDSTLTIKEEKEEKQVAVTTHKKRFIPKPKRRSMTTKRVEKLLAEEKPVNQPKEVTAGNEILSPDLSYTQAKPQQVVLTERDIPISRPDNYRYTPEELALMRQQANNAYMKRLELELEITNYQFEHLVKQ